MCTLRKMVISEKRYAAQFVDGEGNAFKFDDIGCVMRYLETQTPKRMVQACFVMDYSGGGWLDAKQAHHVKANGFQSPMSGGLIALRARPQAEEYARKFNGKSLTFEDLGKP